jgi:hypothetical protein
LRGVLQPSVHRSRPVRNPRTREPPRAARSSTTRPPTRAHTARKLTAATSTWKPLPEVRPDRVRPRSASQIAASHPWARAGAPGCAEAAGMLSLGSHRRGAPPASRLQPCPVISRPLVAIRAPWRGRAAAGVPRTWRHCSRAPVAATRAQIARRAGLSRAGPAPAPPRRPQPGGAMALPAPHSLAPRPGAGRTRTRRRSACRPPADGRSSGQQCQCAHLQLGGAGQRDWQTHILQDLQAGGHHLQQGGPRLPAARGGGGAPVHCPVRGGQGKKQQHAPAQRLPCGRWASGRPAPPPAGTRAGRPGSAAGLLGAARQQAGRGGGGGHQPGPPAPVSSTRQQAASPPPGTRHPGSSRRPRARRLLSAWEETAADEAEKLCIEVGGVRAARAPPAVQSLHAHCSAAAQQAGAQHVLAGRRSSCSNSRRGRHSGGSRSSHA